MFFFSLTIVIRFFSRNTVDFVLEEFISNGRCSFCLVYDFFLHFATFWSVTSPAVEYRTQIFADEDQKTHNPWISRKTVILYNTPRFRCLVQRTGRKSPEFNQNEWAAGSLSINTQKCSRTFVGFHPGPRRCGVRQPLMDFHSGRHNLWLSPGPRILQLFYFFCFSLLFSFVSFDFTMYCGHIVHSTETRFSFVYI